MFSRGALSVLLCTLLFHLISASPAPKLKQDLPNRQPSSETVPDGWTCNNNWYNTNDGCDCGCGVTDPDCNKDNQSLFCHNSDLSPDVSRCELRSNTCVRKPPDEWTCTENWYDTSDGCDCGCGAIDPDCSKDSQSLFCHNSPLSPSESICDETSNRCVPQDWVCTPNWFDTNDGCDCGCGATDPDCNKDGQSLFCHNSPLSPDQARCNLASNICEPTRGLGHSPVTPSDAENPDQPLKVPTKPPNVVPHAPTQSPKNPTQATKKSL